MWVFLGSFSMFSNFYRLHLSNETCVTLEIYGEASTKIKHRTSIDIVMVS